jgi:hypothetical protein
MGSCFKKMPSFMKRFENQGEAGLFQISDPTMDQFRGFAGSARSEITFLEEGDRKARLGGLGGQAGAVDAAANDARDPRSIFPRDVSLLPI